MRSASATPNTSSVTIGCALCVGATPEPYLAAALEAIAGTVDVLVVNDNSGLVRSVNRAVLEASAFAARGALHVRAQPFVDFADMRNRAFAQVAELAEPPDWMLFLDADEVHGEQLRYIARHLLPRLGPEIGNLDAYTYHFWGTPHWITDVARRFVFYRYAPELRWTNAVHERIVNLHGRAFVVPYVYHHYGNVLPPGLLARKHGRYYELGNRVPRPVAEREADDAIYLARTAATRRYRGLHPVAVRGTLREIERDNREAFARLDAAFAAPRPVAARVATAASAANEWLRVELRRLEHPFAYRESTRAR